MINRSHWAFSAPASRLLHLPPLQNPNVTEEPQFTKSKIEKNSNLTTVIAKKIFNLSNKCAESTDTLPLRPKIVYHSSDNSILMAAYSYTPI